MPVTVRQHAFSPKLADGFKDPTATTLWYARGSDDEAAVLAKAQTDIPETYYNLVIKRINYENKGGGFWDLSAEYELPEWQESDGLGDAAEPPTPPPGLQAPIADNARIGPEFSADTSGGTVHITQSLSTNVRKKVGDAVGASTAINYKQAIGVTKDGVAGCDIFAAKFEFSITLKAPFVTWGYIKTCRNLTGRVNINKFLVWDVGEVLYLGCTPNFHGGEGGNGWTCTHKFAVSLNELVVTLSDELEVQAGDRLGQGVDFAKYGWEYLWCDYMDVEVAGDLIQKPRAVYIETVYHNADLAELGFGGPA